MGAAFLGAVEHCQLRKFTFPVSFWTIFDAHGRPCARKWSIYYWKIAPSSSMLDFERASPSLNVEVFAQCRASECPSPPQKSTLRERGAARPRNCVNFPIRKRDKIDEQTIFERKIPQKNIVFLTRPVQIWSLLIDHVFIDLAAPKKAAPIVDMLGGTF